MGLRFKIANWIMGDYLRNYLAVGVRLPLINALDSKKITKLDHYTELQIKKALQAASEIMEI